ncbi:ENTH domain-containing protein C794.11c-like, partial [Neltuma alba]|uniref:ENTH domain-containing protein C794.11c-like n=1 Tax=Neltuma alba TaxID=207710 RepID=UPI0010A51C42
FANSLSNNTSNMDSPLLHEIKKQASFFFKDKIKTARLKWTDVTPVELMTEEATSENPWPPETCNLGLISRGAFEVDDYERIVEILHKRLQKFDRSKWRASYKGLILLEHLLTHGPLRVPEEFRCDEDVIKEIGQLQYIDERGFNWGMRVRKLSERLVKLLENNEFLREERSRARQLSRGIEGFGSFNNQTWAINGSINAFPSKKYEKNNSCCGFHEIEGQGIVNLDKKFSTGDGDKEKQRVHKNMDEKLLKQENKTNLEEDFKIEHPFVDKESFAQASLLSV